MNEGEYCRELTDLHRNLYSHRDCSAPIPASRCSIT